MDMHPKHFEKLTYEQKQKYFAINAHLDRLEREKNMIRAWQAIKERQLEALKPDLEYLDKVAIEAMKTYLNNQHIVHVEAIDGKEYLANISYEIALAMLEESKKLKQELIKESEQELIEESE